MKDNLARYAEKMRARVLKERKEKMSAALANGKLIKKSVRLAELNKLFAGQRVQVYSDGGRKYRVEICGLTGNQIGALADMLETIGIRLRGK